MCSRPTLDELDWLYSRLSPEQRDELLQCLLIAVTLGDETMMRMLEDLMLSHATDELLEEYGVSD